MKKSKFLTRTLGLALVASMSFALTACSGDDEPIATPQPTPVATPAPTPAPTPEPVASLFTPGTYTATADSFNDGHVTLEVTFSADQIVSVSLVDTSDTPSWWRRAYPTIPQMIVHRQSTLDIDAIASATISTNAIIEAVNDTIVQAGANPANLTPQIPTQPRPGATFIAGQHILETTSWQEAPMIMQVVFSESEIVRVQVIEHGDTTTGGNWAGRVIPIIPHQVEEVHSTVGIDIVAGATVTAESVLGLINEAITLAGANPANLTPVARTPGVFWPYGAGGGQPARFHPGVYYATVEAFGGPMTVQAIFGRGNLVRARVVEHDETPDFFAMVFPGGGAETLATIVEGTQTIHGIDVVAGATITHNAFLEAVAETIRMAGSNPDDF